MSRKPFAGALPILLVFSLLLGACAPAATPTPTPVPPTAFPTSVPTSTPEPTSAALTLADILTVGQLTGNTAQAQKVVADLQTRLGALKAKVAQAPKPKVFYEIDDTDPNKPWTAGPKSFTDVLLTLAGAQNIGAGGTGQY